MQHLLKDTRRQHAERLRRDVAAGPSWDRSRRLPDPALGGAGAGRARDRESELLRDLTCLEPACGRGHTANALAEYFGHVEASDIHGYGFGTVDDFTVSTHSDGSFDWVITNPPFRLAEAFIMRALPIARRGVAMLSRTVFVEGIGRYERMYAPYPPSKVAQFTERVPMVQGRLDRKASTATGYAWLVWEKGSRPRRSSVGSRRAASSSSETTTTPPRFSRDDTPPAVSGTGEAHRRPDRWQPPGHYRGRGRSVRDHHLGPDP